MKPPRGLSAGEAALWQQVAHTVTPLNPPRARLGEGDHPKDGGGAFNAGAPAPRSRAGHNSPPPPPLRVGGPPPRDKLGEDFRNKTLDGTWDRRLAHGLISPDAEIDLHGLGIDAAYARLMATLAQATLTGARVLLVIAGKHRPHGDHGFSNHGERGNRRGAIRAKLLDWLAASPHAAKIAAIRPAHQRHGGAGAVYVVLRKAQTF